MHFLPQDEVAGIVRDAVEESHSVLCRRCGTATLDYCGTCEEFYYIHWPDCPRYVAKHDGHACVLVPSVVKPYRLAM